MNPKLKLLGYLTAISFLSVHIATWMYANHLGFTYFSAGEPILIIKYAEWGLGITSTSILTGCTIEEIGKVQA